MPPIKKPASPPAPSPATTPSQRKVIYPEVKARVLKGDSALTHEQAKAYLGWEEVETKDDSVVLTDYNGAKVRFAHNIGNRPYDASLAQTWALEILKRHWRLNGETIIIGKTGIVISGQHRLSGLELAYQQWEQQPHWKEIWPDGPPTMECIIVYGVDESDLVVNTIDTGKPRTTTDAICRSTMFADYPLSDRKQLARVTEYAVRILWDRTGARADAHSLKRTHTDTFEYLERHPRVRDCVVHIYERSQKSQLRDYFSLGYSAGLLYLMGSSSSDGDLYRAGDPPTEAPLLWDRWDRGREFWDLLGTEGPNDLRPVRHALRPVVNGALVNLSLTEKLHILGKAWLCWVRGDAPAPKRLEIKYQTNEDGFRSIAEDMPLFGGIDLGGAKEREEEDGTILTPPIGEGDSDEDLDETEREEDLEGENGVVPTPEEIEARKEEEKQRRQAAEKEREEQRQQKAKEKEQKKKDQAKAKASPSGTGLREQLEELRAEHPDRMFLFVSKGTFSAWEEDADLIEEATGHKAKNHPDGLTKISLPLKELEATLLAIEGAGRQACICTPEAGGPKVQEAAEYLATSNGKAGKKTGVGV